MGHCVYTKRLQDVCKITGPFIAYLNDEYSYWSCPTFNHEEPIYYLYALRI